MGSLRETFSYGKNILLYGRDAIEARRIVNYIGEHPNPVCRVAQLRAKLNNDKKISAAEKLMYERILVRMAQALPEKPNGSSQSVPALIGIIADAKGRPVFEEDATLALMHTIKELPLEKRMRALVQAACGSRPDNPLRSQALNEFLDLANTRQEYAEQNGSFKRRIKLFEETRDFINHTREASGPSSKSVKKRIDSELKILRDRELSSSPKRPQLGKAARAASPDAANV